ncbi:PfkB family carbohydrate kinase [Pseudovibrio denitrificans]|uniref:PfkB family carbohydrate kinase n=1 Tax=Pseudovibrio denitrificans TaxID=258256 RepID=UPI000AAE26E2|nr:PfkB family carbohydrate kinase [Pseudovibrio denitrificans]
MRPHLYRAHRTATLGEETYAKDLAVEPGGGGFITAANLSALGHKTTLLASMPGGPFGSAILEKMQRSGVDLSLSPYDQPMAHRSQP